jgi:hypothetical protein
LSPGWKWWRLPAADRLRFRVHAVVMFGLVWSEVVESWPVLTEESRVELRNYMMASKFLNWQVPVELPTSQHMPPTWLSLTTLVSARLEPPEPSSHESLRYQSEFSVRFLFVDYEIAET